MWEHIQLNLLSTPRPRRTSSAAAWLVRSSVYWPMRSSRRRFYPTSTTGLSCWSPVLRISALRGRPPWLIGQYGGEPGHNCRLSWVGGRAEHWAYRADTGGHWEVWKQHLQAWNGHRQLQHNQGLHPITLTTLASMELAPAAEHLCWAASPLLLEVRRLLVTGSWTNTCRIYSVLWRSTWLFRLDKKSSPNLLLLLPSVLRHDEIPPSAQGHNRIERTKNYTKLNHEFNFEIMHDWYPWNKWIYWNWINNRYCVLLFFLNVLFVQLLKSFNFFEESLVLKFQKCISFL